MRVTGTTLPIRVMVLLLLTACSAETFLPNPIARVAASLTRDKLVAEAQLAPDYLSQAMGQLHGGEWLLVTYRFEFNLQKEWLPDKTLHEAVVRRRLRRNLILERYEMQDLDSKYTTFTADDGEASRFLGNPRFVTMAQRNALQGDKTYLITASFRLEKGGISRMLRVLRDWIFFWEPNTFALQTEYRLP